MALHLQAVAVEEVRINVFEDRFSDFWMGY
jgi:hypothetical protein